MAFEDELTLSELRQVEILNRLLKPGEELRPERIRGIGVVYKIGELTIREERVSTLIKLGLFRIKGHVSFAICPVCGDLDLSLNLFCPNCNSQDLEKVDLVIHYECHYADDVSRFRTPKGLVCPVCDKPLKVVGVDYGRPGISYRCSTCMSVFQFPLFSLTCSNGHVLRLDELALHRSPVLVYEPSGSRQATAVSRVLSLIEALSSHGYRAEPFAVLRGQLSHLEHVVDALVHKGEKRCAVVLIDNSVASPDTVSRLLTLALDLQVPVVAAMSTGFANNIAKFLRLEGNLEERIGSLFPRELVKVIVYSDEKELLAKLLNALDAV